MRVPNSWQQVTLQQFMELASIPTDTGAFDLTNEHIAILCEITQQEVMHLDIATRDRIRERLSFIDTEPTGRFTPHFWHGRKRWRVTDRITKLTAGQYIDVCTYLKHGASQNYHKILAVICQPLRFGVVPRTYDTDRSDRYADELLSLPVPVAMAIAAFFFEQFRGLREQYPNLLGGDKGGEQIDVDPFVERFSWHIVLDNLSNNRREQWPFFLNMGIIEFLNELAYRKEKDARDAEALKQQPRKAH